MENITVYGLIKQYKFSEAIALADKELLANPKDTFVMRNKLLALLNLRQYENVILLSNEIIELNNGESESEFINLGIAEWFSNKKETAINSWIKGETTLYRDLTGGIELQVILFYASLRLCDKTLKLTTEKKIKKLLKSKRANNLQGAIGKYLFSDLQEEELLQKLSDNEILRSRELCKIYFAKAVKNLSEGNSQLFKEYLIKCTNEYGFLEAEYYLAQGELFSII